MECANFLCVFFPHRATLLAFKSTLTVVSNVLSPACLPAITQKPIAPLRTELEREHTQRRQRKASEIGAQAQSMSSSSSTAQSVPNEIEEDTVKIEQWGKGSPSEHHIIWKSRKDSPASSREPLKHTFRTDLCGRPSRCAVSQRSPV